MDAIRNTTVRLSGWSRPAGHHAQLAPIERRKSPRLRVLKKGKLILPNNVSVIDCIIRDQSDMGARLSCEQWSTLPNELQLMFHAIREVRFVRVVWRHDGELGVQFLSPPRPALRMHI